MFESTTVRTIFATSVIVSPIAMSQSRRAGFKRNNSPRKSEIMTIAFSERMPLRILVDVDDPGLDVHEIPRLRRRHPMRLAESPPSPPRCGA